ncbi:unnamed protein product [Diamesa hyperborea]
MMERRLQFTLGLALHIFILLVPTSGLFEATMSSINMMISNDTSFMNSNGLKIKRVNRNHVLTGSLEFFVDVSNDYQMVTYFLKKSGDGYNRLPYKIGPYLFCKYFDEDKYFADELRRKSNFPPKGTCPWPKQKYTFYNYETSLVLQRSISPYLLEKWDHKLKDIDPFTFAYKNYVKWEKLGGKELKLPGFYLTNRQMFWVALAHHFYVKIHPNTKDSEKVEDAISYYSKSFLRNDYFRKDFNCSED